MTQTQGTVVAEPAPVTTQAPTTNPAAPTEPAEPAVTQTQGTVVAEPAPVTTQTPTTNPAAPADPAEPAVTQTPGPIIAEPVAVTQAPSISGGDDTDTLLGGIGSDISLGDAADATAMAGRVTTLRIDAEDVADVKITSGLDYGNVTVNPDNSLAIVLTGTTDDTDQSFDIEVTHADGSVTNQTVALNVTTGEQQGGWGLGEFYLLEEDENESSIIESGDNHRVVHVSGSDDALSLEDIAALEGVPVSEINFKFWTTENDYGGTPETAVNEEVAETLWRVINHPDNGPSSNWLLFDKGYTYDQVNLLPENITGESELHPIYIGAYGEGDRPIIEAEVRNVKVGTDNVVIEGLEISNQLVINNAANFLLEDVLVTDDEFLLRAVDGFTLRDSSVWDVTQDAPLNGETWDPHPNRISGLYASHSEGLLIENTFFDHNAWEEGYDPGLSAAAGQPPSQYSHNIYLQSNNLDISFRDNIISRAAGTGVQFRSGGFVEDNVFLDNNGAINPGRGGSDAEGNYTLFTGNVITSGGDRTADDGVAARTIGLTNQGNSSTLHENVIAHVADPNNAAEIDAKGIVQYALRTQDFVSDPYYNDTIVYNWLSDVTGDGTEDMNVDDLDIDVLDQTTIQIFAANLLGQDTATIADLAEHLRGEAEGAFDDVVDADVIIEFFRAGFGLEVDLERDAETLRFVPNDLGDGVRWDNRLNWTSDDLPGVGDGDRVELGGNWVQYAGGGTTRISDLDLGDGGQLNVSAGYLEVEDHLSVGDTGAEISVDRAGQFWTNGYTDQDLLTISEEGGRFANTGLFTGNADLQVSDNAQAILATDGADYVVGAGSSISITGGDARVGFDGDQGETGVLLLSDEAALEFYAQDGALGQITEFDSGRFNDDGEGIQSGVNLGDATLRVDISDLAGIGNISHELISADEIIGAFGSVEIDGLDPTQNAVLTIDYETDAVTLNLGTVGVGTGAVAIEVLGDEADAAGQPDLYAALTNGHGIYPDDPPEDIPDEADDDPFV